MKNDTSAILVSIEKLESSLDSIAGASSSASITSDSLVAAIETSLKPTLDMIHDSINRTQESQYKLEDSLQSGFKTVEQGINNSASNVTDAVTARINLFESKMGDSQKLIQDQVS